MTRGAGYPFLSEHFLPDPDGLNADLHDGDALFLALAPAGQEAPATPDGWIFSTLLFATLDAPAEAEVHLPAPTSALNAQTRVRRLDLTNVTGDISASAVIRVLPCATGDFDGDTDVDLADFARLSTMRRNSNKEHTRPCAPVSSISSPMAISTSTTTSRSKER